MNVWAEFVKALTLDPVFSNRVPSERIFTGQVPDTFTDPDTGKPTAVDAPYVIVAGPDSAPGGGTSAAINRIYTVQVAVYAERQAEAIELRERATTVLEEAELFLVGETLFDVSQDVGGVDQSSNGMTRAYMRFNVETLLPRPRRKG